MSAAARGRLRSLVGDGVRATFKLTPFEQALATATHGRPYEGLRSRLPPLPSSYAPGTLRSVERLGCRLDLDLSDLIDWYLFWGFQDPSHEAIVKRCAVGATVVDIGANKGITAIRLAQATGPRGRVIALEADPGNFAVLAARVADNRLSWVEPLNLAAADRPGRLRIAPRDAANSGMHQISDAGAEVEAVRIDDLPLERVDLIKIDVEGYEARVLDGAAATIAAHRPVLIVEVSRENLGRFGTTPAAVIGHLERHGYTVVDAATGHPPADLEHFDALATPAAAAAESPVG